MEDGQSTDNLSALEAALKLSAETVLVTEEQNDKLVKDAVKDARKLLKELRAKKEARASDIEEYAEIDYEELLGLQSFGMGPRQFVSNANITPDEQRQIDLATEQFRQSVERVDNQVLAQYVQAVMDGDYAEAERILQQAQESPQVNTLFFALLTIGAILLPLYAKQRIVALFNHFNLNTVFTQTDSSERAMRLQAQRGAKSHIRTIAKDIKNSLDDAINEELTSPQVEATIKDQYPELSPLEDKKFVAAVTKDADIYAFARDLVLKGDSKATIVRKLQESFSTVGKRRANLIAGNEANRVFTMSQFDADQQFLAQNKLTSKAYKRLVSNTGHPEAICKYIIEKTAKDPIPFTQDFIKFGDTIEAEDNGKVRKFTANYEKLQSGHIHVNCHCRYELLIKQDDGTFINTFDFKVLNLVGVEFEEKKHKRAGDGKFAKKPKLDMQKYAKEGLAIKKSIEKEAKAVYWAKSMKGDVENAESAYEDVVYEMSQLYRAAFKDAGLTDEDYNQLKRDQIDYSIGGGMRDEDGNYISEPALQKPSKAQQVHSALTQAILKEEFGETMTIYRGQYPDYDEPTGMVSYSDARFIAFSFGPQVTEKEVSTSEVLYHYLLDFTSAHPSEQEVIIRH